MTVSHKAVEETTHASALERSPAYVEARRSATDLIEGWEAYEEGMLDRGFGRIINISSVNGQKGQFGQANYAATKAGIHGFTISVAQEGARKGVTCNTAQRHWRNSILAVDQYRLSRCVRFSF